MKTIYIDRNDFTCHMEQDGTRLEVHTGVFDGMSDREIEGYRFVPEGYRWADPDSGESYTGQHVMPVNHALGGTLRELRQSIEHLADEGSETEAALQDVYAALTELAELIV